MSQRPRSSVIFSESMRLEIGGGRVVDIEMEFMSFEERDKEKEILRQRDHDDMVSGRCSPQEVNDRNAIDWSLYSTKKRKVNQKT